MLSSSQPHPTVPCWDRPTLLKCCPVLDQLCDVLNLSHCLQNGERNSYLTRPLQRLREEMTVSCPGVSRCVACRGLLSSGGPDRCCHQNWSHSKCLAHILFCRTFSSKRKLRNAEYLLCFTTVIGNIRHQLPPNSFVTLMIALFPENSRPQRQRQDINPGE